MIQLLSWDTENFGIKVGNLIPNEAVSKEWFDTEIAKAKEQDFDLLYARNFTLPVSCLNEQVLLADVKLLYSKNIEEKLPSLTEEEIVSIKNESLTPDLLNLSLECGRFSRYKLDVHMPTRIFEELYKQWMIRSLNGEIATDVLACRKDGKYVGVLTYAKKGNVVTIGLVGVSPDYAGKGIGTALMTYLFSELEKGDTVEVVTQRCNLVGCHYYEKNGFTLTNSTPVYHIWL